MENIKDSPDVLPSLIGSSDSNQITGFNDGVMRQDGTNVQFMASLDLSHDFSERSPRVPTVVSYYIKSMTPHAFQLALRQKDGELSPTFLDWVYEYDVMR
ncbi:TATA element modulatory factor 1 TATA binding [Artemisia annua]|uniref:TATA element modulatory factor 1 TATA binding n=1 Tax=Artemisia annua TaxID=35608 RepID=A0A2U1MJZ8_ARTAN|nr:TATA element modulatory factor 1 TATA binding [Artemisia annua]